MKKIFIYSILSLGLFFNACSQDPGKALPVIAPEIILKDFMGLLNYERDHLALHTNFSPYGEDSKPITKAQFLKLYATGEYLPVQIHSENDNLAYRLYQLQKPVNIDISRTLKRWGTDESRRYNLQGTLFPAFNFTDLDGKIYSPAMLKGNIIALKSWFIDCKPCREEMPALNSLIDKYKKRKDMLFVSLASDAPDELKAFLKQTTFNYTVISDQHNFMERNFQEPSSPTHILIDKNGQITLITNKSTVLIKELNALANKKD